MAGRVSTRFRFATAMSYAGAWAALQKVEWANEKRAAFEARQRTGGRDRGVDR
jgi:hypothetical protein